MPSIRRLACVSRKGPSCYQVAFEPTGYLNDYAFQGTDEIFAHSAIAAIRNIIVDGTDFDIVSRNVHPA
jgi:hypothetical protein